MTGEYLVDVEPGRGEGHLERHTGVAHGAACGVHLGERPARPLALIDVLTVGVEADLYRSYRQAREPRGDLGVEALAVRLDLELHARGAELLGERQEMRDDQRLSAAEHDVGHVVANDLVCDLHRAGASSSSGKRFPGAESVQQCRQQRSQSRVICQDTKQRRLQRIDAVHGGKPRQPLQQQARDEQADGRDVAASPCCAWPARSVAEFRTYGLRIARWRRAAATRAARRGRQREGA